MPNITQHNIVDPSIHFAVEADGVPREAAYVTTYDDDTTEESMQMVYRDGQAVKSVPLADWPAEQQALATRDAERAKHQAMRDGLGAAARAHAGKDANLLTFPEIRDLFALFLEQQGMLDADGKVRPPPTG